MRVVGGGSSEDDADSGEGYGGAMRRIPPSPPHCSHAQPRLPARLIVCAGRTCPLEVRRVDVDEPWAWAACRHSAGDCGDAAVALQRMQSIDFWGWVVGGWCGGRISERPSLRADTMRVR